MRALELYSGIGGFAQASTGRCQVVAAIDHNHLANQVYASNFEHPVVVKNLESVPLRELERWEAELWWMSPPCQPYTIRGAQQDLDDPRSKSFLRIIEAIKAIQPPFLALENVPWFEDSNGHALLLKTLEKTGYLVEQRQVCPTELGLPNVRKRFYLVAAKQGLDPITVESHKPAPLHAFLDAVVAPDLAVPEELELRYGENLHTVEADDPGAVAACFTSAYGRSPVYCGSYLRQHGKRRYFSPAEIARLLGFSSAFRLPPSYSRRQLWKLIGNSLSIPVVRRVLEALPSPRAETSPGPAKDGHQKNQ